MGTIKWMSAAMLAAMVAAAPAAIAQQPVKGGVLKIVVASEPPSLVSASNSSLWIANISTKIHEGLIKYGLNMEMQPSLAESWDFAKDGLSMTFKLRQGVKWHDGQPFTSADVKFSMDEVWKKLHPRGRTTFAAVTGTETPDAHTVIFRLSRPTPAALVSLSAYEAQIVPKHIYEGKDFNAHPGLSAPIGTGPFKFKEWRKGQYAELERFDDYWDKGKPHLDGLIFRFVADAGSRAVALEAGDAYYSPFSPVPASDVTRLEKLPHLGIETKGYAFFSPMQVAEVNTRKPPLNDVRVRQAIRHALNLDFLVKNIWFGFGVPATSPIQSTSPFYLKDTPQLAYDVNKANALLDEAGYKRGAGGNRFTIRLLHGLTGENPRTSEYIKQALARVGVQVELQSGDLGAFIRRIYTENDFDLSVNSMFLSPDPTIGVQRMYWTGAIAKGVAFSNSSGYSNPEADKLWEVTQSEADPAKRTAAFHELQRIIHRDQPVINLLEAKYFTVYNKKLVNHTLTADGPYGTFADAYIVP